MTSTAPNLSTPAAVRVFSDGPGPALGVIVLFGVVFATYFPVLSAGFVWDDDDYVTENTLLREPGGLQRIWLEPGATVQYYPLVFTTFWVEHRVWGLRPAGYHANNVMLHALAAVLAWRIVRRLELPGGWLAALLFAVHPVHVESVAWITERKNVLSGVLYLASMLAYLNWQRLRNPDESQHVATSTRRSAHAGPVGYLLSLCAFAAALLSKSVVCSLPAALLVLTWWKRGRLGWRDVVPLLPFLAIGVGSALLTIRVETHHVGATGREFDLTALQRCLIAGRAVWFYTGKLLWPADLLFIYPRWRIDPGQLAQFLPLLAAIGLLAMLSAARRHVGRGPLAAALLFGGTLLPALGFIDVFPMKFSFVADHFQYLASLALIIPGAALLSDWVARFEARSIGVVAALWVVALAALANRQTLIYRDVETLWLDTLTRNPQCAIAHSNYATVIDQRGLTEQAWPHYLRALTLDPTDYGANHNLFHAAAKLGRLGEAEQAYRAVVAADPLNDVAHFSLGMLAGMRNDPNAAIRHFDEAVRINPDFVEARSNRATMLLRLGRVADAAAELRDVVSRRPDLAESRWQLAIALERLGDIDAAAAEYRFFARLRAADPEAAPRVADELERLGRPRDAVEVYREALARQPDASNLLADLAWLLATNPDDAVRRGPEAVRLARRAVAMSHGQDAAAWDALAAALAETGEFGEAVTTARRGREVATQQGLPAAAAQIAERQALYESRRPCRTPRQTTSAPQP